jgi:hypothetical protein
MHIDRYTKGVLTVIAAALVTMVVQNSVATSSAESDGAPQKVMICNTKSDTSSTDYVCATVNSDGRLQVTDR